MMELTRKGEYAIRAMLYLSRQPAGRLSLVEEIAESAGIPRSFLSKILQHFTRVGLVASFRGMGGGFSLARDPSRITLLEVVEAIEGPVLPNRCLTGEGTCERDGACRVHEVWRKVRNETVAILAGVTIGELAGSSEEHAVDAAGERR